MSSNKRPPKRSIIGSRVCARLENGKFYSGVVQAIKTPGDYNNAIDVTPFSRYTVLFDSNQGRTSAEVYDHDLIGFGFQSIVAVELVAGQKCFVTYNGREISGEVCEHHAETDLVTIKIQPTGIETPVWVQKRLDDVRLMECRKSPRLADQDTDFARLADMAGDRKRTSSHTITVPSLSSHSRPRKRRTSSNHDEYSKDSKMDECSAALVLMSLSCSPHSPYSSAFSFNSTSPGSNSSAASYRSTPSPPPLRGSSFNTTPFSSSSGSDEGIDMDDYDELPRKKMILTRIVFQCTWPSCLKVTDTCEAIEAHVRKEHLKIKVCDDSEEDFYISEIELGVSSPPPTLSHQDMARPFHEDPDYQRQLVGNMRQTLMNQNPKLQSPHRLPKLTPRARSPKTPVSPRRVRGENKKCRKVYGMEHKEQWCTQCRWKKACIRFGD